MRRCRDYAPTKARPKRVSSMSATAMKCPDAVARVQCKLSSNRTHFGLWNVNGDDRRVGALMTELDVNIMVAGAIESGCGALVGPAPLA